MEDLGHPVDFLRDSALADDHTPLTPVLRWVLDRYRADGVSFDSVCLLMPCAPLVEASDLQDVNRVFEEHGRHFDLLSVAEYPAPLEWAFRREDDGRLTPCEPGKFEVRSQDLRPAFHDAGAFIFFHAGRLSESQPPTEMNFISYVLPRHKVIDIDEEQDWKTAEILFRGTGYLPRKNSDQR